MSASTRNRTATVSSGRSSQRGRSNDMQDFTMSQPNIMRYFEPCAATASMFLYAQGSSIVCCHHDTLTIERRFSRHSDEVQLLAVDTQSEIGAGRLVVSYDAGQTAIVWDIMTGDEVARFASYEHLTTAAWMRNGNVAFGNTQGNIILFEPTTSEHISSRTIDQIAVTALAPAADCRTFAIGYQNGSLLVATLQPRFTILHNLGTSRAPSPIVTLNWHASSSRQKSDMLASQTHDGDLRVWSVSKSYSSDDPAKVVRILKRTDNYQVGPNWMGWSKNGRIIQHSDSETLSWDVRTKHVTWDNIPTLEHVRGLAVYGPGASLFTLGANNTVQQFDLNTPSIIVANVQHPANLLPPSPPVSIEEQQGQKTSTSIVSDSDATSGTIEMGISESDEDHLSPFDRIVGRKETGTPKPLDPYDADTASAASSHSGLSSISRSSGGGSRTPGRYPSSAVSRGMTENTYISAGSSLRSSAAPYQERDMYSMSGTSMVTGTSMSSYRSRRSRPSRLRNEVLPSPVDSKVQDLFKYTRSRLSDIPYKHPGVTDNSRLTNDDLRKQMLSTIFGWNKEIDDLVREELSRHNAGSPGRILLMRWLGDIDADVMAASSASMTSSDWMLLALSGIGGQASQHKLGRAYVQRLLEHGDVHAAVTILIGMGDHNDAIEIYVSHKRYMEALILTCLFFPAVWERQSAIIKKWGEWAVMHGQQQLAVRCFASTGAESSEPWTSPSAAQVTFQSINQNLNDNIPEVLSPPLSPPGVNRVPSNMFLTRTRPSIYMSACMIGWAGVSAATAGVKNYSGLVACRFFLGFVEAPFYPGALYLLSIFYTRKELATRISLLYTGQVVSTGCSGLIAAATFSTLDNVKGIAGWQWLFIIEGSVTALVAIFGFFLLPDDPSVTRWLTEEERKLAVDRIRRDTVGQQERGSTWDGLKQACKDPKTWLFCLMQNLHISACSFNNFFPTIVRTMGFQSTAALLLTAPPYFVSGLLGIPFAWSSGKLNERTWHITAGLSLAIVGFAMTCGSTNNAVRYAATFLYATGAYSVGSVILGWVSNTLSQTPEKKAVAYSLVNVTANLAYIYCAYLWPSSDGPKYMMGFSTMIAFAATSIMCAWAMRFWLIKTNKQIRESEDENVNLYAY